MKTGKKRLGIRMVLVGCLCLVLTAAGCASSDNSASNDSAGEIMVNTTSAAMGWDSSAAQEIGEWETEAVDTDTGESVSVPDTARKLIYNADLTVETLEYDVFMQEVREEIERLGGYIESMENNSGGYYYGNTSRFGSITARIPADQFEMFLSTVGSLGNVVNETRDVKDITLTYVDTQSRREALEIEQERLLALLERADQIEDIIALEERLSSVRYQLESYASQLRTYDNLVDYSTVTMSIEEVIEVTREAPQTLADRMSRGFSNTLREIEEGLQDAAVWLVTNCLYLIFCTVVIVIAVLAARRILRRPGKRSGQKKDGQEEKEEKEQKKE